MTQYRDNFPANIEAPQRVYVQYSQDIIFDYTQGKWPLGEAHEGFIWENVYIPVPHSYGDLQLDRHVWMRWRIGERTDWTLPMRFTDSFSNIESTEPEINLITGAVTFRLKYTLNTGEIIYSEPITLYNGLDGRSITNSQIVGTNLVLTFSDNTTQNVGRVVGYDGNGFPSGTVNPNEIPIVDGGGNIIWTDFLTILNNNLSATSPIDYTNGIISHLNTDGNKHVPVGGNSGDVLSTDGLGNYTWYTIPLNNYIPWTAIDDSAGPGAIDKLYSVDKILSLLGGASFGIKYSVTLFTDLAALTPLVDELAVVTGDPLYPNRTVFKYNGVTWDPFFDLDATHNHDDRYYLKTELNISGGGGEVHWDNVTNKPAFYSNWLLTGNSGGLSITNGATLNIVGSGGVNTSIVGDTMTITAIGTTYTEGAGIDIAGTVISHEDTSSVADTTNLGGVVLQNLTFDTFGHVLTRSSVNLDGRYTPTSNFQTLTFGPGLTGFPTSYYNPLQGNNLSVNFGTGTDQVARGGHLPTFISGTVATSIVGVINQSTLQALYFSGINKYLVTLQFSFYYTSNLNLTKDMVVGTITSPVSLYPDTTLRFPGTFDFEGSAVTCQFYINSIGEIRITFGTKGSAIAYANYPIEGTITYLT